MKYFDAVFGALEYLLILLLILQLVTFARIEFEYFPFDNIIAT